MSLGAALAAAGRGGWSDQDLAGPRNREMRQALESAFARHPPLVYAAGHDHNLQVLRGQEAHYVLVSGAGFYGHVSRASWTQATLFAAEASGYMRLDVGRDGSLRLGVRVVAADGRVSEPFSMLLE